MERNGANFVLNEAKFFGIAAFLRKILTKYRTKFARCSPSRCRRTSLILRRIETFVKDVFKTSLEVFFEALRLSPNAQGYVSGSITELLLKQHLEENEFEVHRIREKWEGRKHSNHHGDFYFRRQDASWYVLESKGVKSNSEKWHKLYNYDKLLKFLFAHSDKISWIDESQDIEPQIKG